LFSNVLQPTHLLVILIVALLLLGPKRLPETGRALGKGLKEFRSSISGELSDGQIAAAPNPAHQTDSPGDLRDSPNVATPTGELAAVSRAPAAAEKDHSDSPYATTQTARRTA
jgi:sec-independent protein translocase protein TatA